MDEWVTAVANVGFPIVVAGYLLLRIEIRLERLAESVRELANVIRSRGIG